MAHARPEEEKVEMDMTPMIDVTFQLLIFFIITMKFRMLERKLETQLPTDFGLQSGPVVEENFVVVKLRQREDGDARPLRERETEVQLDNRLVSSSELHAQLDELRRRIPDAGAKIDAGRGVPHGRVVGVLDALQKAGFDQISFVGLTAWRDADSATQAFDTMRQEMSGRTR